MGGEDDVGVAGGEVPPLAGVACLEDHRVALGAARQGRRHFDVDQVIVNLDRPHRSGPQPRWRVGPRAECAVGPAVPDRPGGAQHLLGPPVAIGVVKVAAAAEVLAGPGVIGGDYVPVGPATRQQVQAGCSRRARSASSKVTFDVETRPMRSVTAASAASWVMASGRPAMSRSWIRPPTSRRRRPSPRKKASPGGFPRRLSQCPVPALPCRTSGPTRPRTATSRAAVRPMRRRRRGSARTPRARRRTAVPAGAR